MKLLFLNGIKVKFVESPFIYESDDFARVFTSLNEIEKEKLFGTILIKNADIKKIPGFFEEISDKEVQAIKSVTFIVDDVENSKETLKKQFSIVKAAGGIVKNQAKKYLMIYRSGKWDLPKGKLEKNEKPRQAAIREVEEECNVEVKLVDKICSTWHNYERDGQKVLKKTKWYLMDLESDLSMKPQTEEDIQEIRWMDEKELNQAFANTYKTIIEVFKQLNKKSEV